jgi:DNA-binding PadR family transcriptional regulator
MKPYKNKVTFDISTSNIKLPYAIELLLRRGRSYTIAELHKELDKQKPGKWREGEVVNALHGLSQNGMVHDRRVEYSSKGKKRGTDKSYEYRFFIPTNG